MGWRRKFIGCRGGASDLGKLRRLRVISHVTPEGIVHGDGVAPEPVWQMAVEERQLAVSGLGGLSFQAVEIERANEARAVRPGFAMDKDGLGSVADGGEDLVHFLIREFAAGGKGVIEMLHPELPGGVGLRIVPVLPLIGAAQIQDAFDAMLADDRGEGRAVHLCGAINQARGNGVEIVMRDDIKCECADRQSAHKHDEQQAPNPASQGII